MAGTPCRFPPNRSGGLILLRTYCGAPLILLLLPVAAVAEDELDALFGPPPTVASEQMPAGPVASETQVQKTSEPAPAASIQLAQPAPTAAPRQPRRQIEEIVVTAQKTEQSLSDVPVSVTALQGEFLKNNNVGNLTEASAYVPNVRVESTSPSSPQVFIRGFGTNTFNPSFEPSVGLVQDEIFYARGAYFTESMFDLERIEVLRGPQGTLFGKNTIAGVFNIVTRGAPEQGVEADLSYARNEWADDRFEAGVGARLSERWGVRLAALEDHRHGRLYNTTIDRYEDTLEQSAQRLRLDYQGDGRLDFGLVGQRSESQVHFWPRQLYELDDDTRSYLQNFDPQLEDNPHDFQTSFDYPGYMNKDSWSAAAHADLELGPMLNLAGLNTTVVLGVSKLHVDQYQDLDTSPADLLRLYGDTEDYQQYSAEWRFSGHGDAPWGQGLEFVAGLFAMQTDYHIVTGIEAGQDLASYALSNDGLQLLSGGAIAGIPFGGLGQLTGLLAPLLGPLVGGVIGQDRYEYDFDQRVQTYAAFAQLSWHLDAHWSITPGLRINREVKDIRAKGESQCRTKPLTQQCIVQLLVSGEDYQQFIEREEDNLSPKLSLMYRHDDDLSLFANWSRGYKSGGANAISFTDGELEYEPETATAWELGIKSHWLQRSLSLNATLYRMDFDDLQVLAFNSVFFDVTNAASAYSQGLELDAYWLTPYQPLNLAASVGWLDARYDRYVDAPAPVSDGVNAQQDLSGKTLAFAPRWAATLSPTLQYRLGQHEFTLGLNARYQAQQYTDTDLDPATRVPGHVLYSAHLRVAPPSQRWSVTLGAKNLSDKRVLNQAIDSALFPGTFLANQQPGRVVYGKFSLQW